MTVGVVPVTAGPYPGNDVADTFPFTFVIDEADEIAVYEKDPLGVVTLLTLTADYTVSGLGDPAGGSVTRVAGPLPTGYLWYLRVNYAATQANAFKSQGGFFPAVHEYTFDKLTYLVKQALDEIKRAPRMQVYDESAETQDMRLPDATTRANKALIFDALGNCTVSVDNYVDQAANAAASAAAAAASEAAALGYLNDFKGRYYGPLASDPALDPLGNPIDGGDLYYNTTTNVIRFYDAGGAIWVNLVNITAVNVPYTPSGQLTAVNVQDAIDQLEAKTGVLTVRNASAGAMVKGQAVYISGSTGTNLNVGFANASAEATSSTTIAVLDENLGIGISGRGMTMGLVSGFDTSLLTEGAAIWLDATDGGLTTTKPLTPNHLVFIGFCVRQHATQGSIYVHIGNGQEMDELHDVLIGTYADKDVLQYDLAAGYWRNRTLAAAGIHPAGNLNLTGLTGGTRVLTSAEFANSSFDITGTLTADQTIQIPDGQPGIFVIDNGTTGAFSLIIKHAATAGIPVPQGHKYMMYTNGSIVETIQVALAGSTKPVVAKTGAYAVQTSEAGSVFDCSNGSWTLTLPAAATAGNGFTVDVRNTGLGLITVTDGTFSIPCHTGESLQLVCDGTTWHVVAQYANPVDLSLYTAADAKLAVGQMGYIDHGSLTSIPLNVATADGEEYVLEWHIDQSSVSSFSGATFLNPNNTTYASAVINQSVYGNGTAAGSSGATGSAFPITVNGPAYGCKAFISTRTKAKTVEATLNSVAPAAAYTGDISGRWADTTTAWVSLGTFVLTNAHAGYITVRRIK